jgi:2'-5' RNA ligase
MDLLSLLDCSSDSDNDCASPARGNNKKTKRDDGASQSTTTSSEPLTKKPRRGSTSIVSSSQASPSTFQRSIPHQRGHWAGHIMVPVRCFSRGSIHQSVLTFQRRLEEHGYSGPVVQHDERHLSLSKCFSLQAGNVEPFVQKLTERLSEERSTRLYVNRSGDILINDEKTRTFWGWQVQPNAVLRRLVAHVDEILQQYNQPLYYENPTFHISLASLAGTVYPFHHRDDDEESSNASEDKENDSDDSDDDKDCMIVDRVHCKFGNCKTYQIKLQSSSYP